MNIIINFNSANKFGKSCVSSQKKGKMHLLIFINNFSLIKLLKYYSHFFKACLYSLALIIWKQAANLVNIFDNSKQKAEKSNNNKIIMLS